MVDSFPNPEPYVTSLIDTAIGELQELAHLQGWELAYLKRRKLLRAYSLIIELMGKTEE